MLLHQGAASFQLWTGEPAPLDLMREALEAALAERASSGNPADAADGGTSAEASAGAELAG